MKGQIHHYIQWDLFNNFSANLCHTLVHNHHILSWWAYIFSTSCATALYLTYTSTPVHNLWNVVRLPCILCTLLHLSTMTGMLCDRFVSYVHFYTCPQSMECCATALYLMYTSTPVHNQWNVVQLPYVSGTLLQYTCPQSPECCVTDSLLNAYLCYASFPQSLEY